jgi:hypothetical protein
MPEYKIEEQDDDLRSDGTVPMDPVLTRDGEEIANFMGEAQALDYRDYLIDQAKEDA